MRSPGVVVGETERECVVCGECHLFGVSRMAFVEDTGEVVNRRGSWLSVAVFGSILMTRLVAALACTGGDRLVTFWFFKS